MTEKKQPSDAEGIAERTIEATRSTIGTGSHDNVWKLTMTQKEVDELELLCYFLGAARNACVNFATKYFCSLLNNTTVELKFPNVARVTKKNPAVSINITITPEVKAAIQTARTTGNAVNGLTDVEFIATAVVMFTKKLLPPKTKRKRRNG